MTFDDRTPTLAPDLGTAAADGMPQEGDRLADRFVVHQRLGRGGSGTVYEALDTRLDRRVALKVVHANLVDEQARERLRREVRASASGHPNLVQVYELYDSGRWIFLALELVQGPCLRERLSEEKQLGVDETVRIGAQVAAALAHLHAQGLVHRDVKPGNILVASDGTAKLCDMGLVRHVDRGMTVTETAMVVGTPDYMAPEQASGAQLTPAADVYALGLTLYRCLTGSVPLTGDSPVATGLQRQRARPPAVRASRPDCPRWLQRLISWMLEAQVTDRPSARQAERALAQRRAGPRLTHRQRLAAVCVVAVIVLVAVALPALWSRRTAAIQVGEQDVFGVDRKGRRTWVIRTDNRIEEAQPADLDGDGSLEMVVTTRAHAGVARLEEPTPAAEILVVDRRGRTMTHVRPDELARHWPYPFAKTLNPTVMVCDVDGDGHLELVARCIHPSFYPTHILVFWSRYRTWDELLAHPGNLYALEPALVDGRPRLLGLGVNNPNGMLPVFLEIELIPPPQRERFYLGTSILEAPGGSSRQSVAGRWLAYVLLSEDNLLEALSPPELHHKALDTVEISWVTRTTLDRWRNPAGGPNAGRDLLEDRLVFCESLRHQLTIERLPPRSDQVDAAVASMRSQFQHLLAEQPYRTMLALFGARALAATGDHEGALRVARDGAADTGNEDLVLLVASLEAIRGDLDAAAERLSAVIARPKTARGVYDAPHLLLRVAVQRRDRQALAASVRMLASRAPTIDAQGQLAATLMARARVWWNEVTEADCRVRSWSYAPAGDALACLARWRLGRTLPGDPEAMRQLMEASPDATCEAKLALAASLHALGDKPRGIAILGELIGQLETPARSDFAAWQILQLAREVEGLMGKEGAQRQPAA